MTIYATGNALGSTDPRDLLDNAQNFDNAVNDVVNDTWVDRFGVTRKTLKGYDAAFDAAQDYRTNQFNTYLAATGFENPPIQYFDGTPVTVDRNTQLITRDGNLYSVRMPATFPYALSGNWEIDQTHLVLRNDQAVRQDLAELTGDEMVGATLPNGQGGTVRAYLELLEKRTAKGIYDFAHLVTSRPTPSNPATWDWTPAFQASANTGAAVTLPDELFLSGPVTYAPGWRVYGQGGGRFLQENARTVVRSLNAGEHLFKSTVSTFTGQREGASLYDVRLESDYPFQCGDYSVAVTDGGASPYEMRTVIARSSFAPITTSTGDGIVLVKCFDHVLEGNEVTGFDRSIIELGCDIGSIRNNRVINFLSFGLLQLSTATFGSQTDVTKNEFLGGGTNSVYIKTTARHVRLYDNYFERSGAVTVKGFIDVSATDAPELGPNPVSTTRLQSVSVLLNRIDSKHRATGFVYRYEPTGFFVEIEDVGTSGPLSTLPWLTIEGGELPLFGNTFNSVMYRFKGGSQNPDVWRSFEQGSVRYAAGSIGFDNLSLLDLDNSELRRNNSHLDVRLLERGILLKVSLGGKLFCCTLRGSETVNNPNFKDGASYTVKVIARARSGAASLSLLKIITTGSTVAQQGSTVVTALTEQASVITTTLTGVTSDKKVGVAFHVTGTTGDVVIDHVSFTAV